MHLPDVCKKSTYPTSTRPEPFDSPRLAAEERDALDGAPPASAGLPHSPRPRVRATRPACAGHVLFRGDQGRALPVPPASSRSREQRSSRAAFLAAPRASETASDTPVAPGGQLGWLPGTKDRRRPPPVKEAGCSIRGAFHRPSARAFAGFCNRERFTSTAVNRLDPALPARGCPRAGLPGRRRPSRGMPAALLGSGESDAASAAPHPPPGVPGGITPKPICPSTPVARSWRGRLKEPTMPRHEVPSEGTEVPSCERAHPPLARSVPAAEPRLRDALAGRPVPRAPPRRGARFPRAQGAFEAKEMRRLPPVIFSTGCCQPGDGLPAWPSRRAPPW